MSAHLPSVSFVIPVRNDARRLDRCLRSIRANRYPPSLIHLVVVDNGSTDESAAVARGHEARVLSLPGLRVGALRNTGAHAAETELLAFVDADHEIDSEWIITASGLLRDSKVGGVGAPYETPVPGTWVQRAYGGLRRHPAGTERVEWLGSGNLAVRRSIFDAVGGFDTTLETCEDVDLCQRLRARGVQLLADRRLRSVHHGDPRTLRQVFLGELWRGRDNIRVSLRPPRSIRMFSSAFLPVVCLLCGVGILAGLSVPHGGRVAGAATLLLLAIIGLRSALMLSRAFTGLTSIPQAAAVATVYELGRALSVLGIFSYGHRRPDAVSSGVSSGLDGRLPQ